MHMRSQVLVTGKTTWATRAVSLLKALPSPLLLLIAREVWGSGSQVHGQTAFRPYSHTASRDRTPKKWLSPSTNQLTDEE